MKKSQKAVRAESEIKVETPFLNVEEAAAFLRVARRTMYNWIGMKRAMKLPVRNHGGRLVFTRDELIAWSNRRNGIESVRLQA